MSHSPTLFHTQPVHAKALPARSDYGIVSAAVAAAVVAGLLTATVLTRAPSAAEVHDAPSAAVAPVTSAASPGTGVPEAAGVFNGKDMPVEAPAPTF